MNALELLAALEESGTGAQKMDAARAVAKAKGTTLRAMPARVLVAEMVRRHELWLAAMDMGGARRERLYLPADCQPGTCWPEGTLAKAQRILAGKPAEPEAVGTASSVYDVDEEPPPPQPLKVEPEDEPEPPELPGIRAVEQPATPTMPGLHEPRKRGRPKKEVHSFSELAEEQHGEE